MRQPSPDDRRFRRVPTSVRVYDRSDFHDTYDLCSGGFSIACTHPLPTGSRANFTLMLERQVELLGEVTWAREAGPYPGMGVRILQTCGDGQEWLDSYVEKLIKDADRL